MLSKQKINNQSFICARCFQGFWKKETFEQHEEDCKAYEPVKTIIPKKEEKVIFKNLKKSLRISYVGFADFECLLPPISTCQPNPRLAYKYQLLGKYNNLTEDVDNGIYKSILKDRYNLSDEKINIIELKLNKQSYTIPYQKHLPIGFCLYIKYKHGEYKPPITYRGKDAVYKFMDILRAETIEIMKFIRIKNH